MKHTLQNLLAEGQTAAVIARLRQIPLSDHDLVRAIIQTSARFAELERQQHAGTLAQEDLRTERNSINVAVLHLIDQLPEITDPEDTTPPTNTDKTVIQHADKIYNIDRIDQANFS